jgi:hypothetical protein
MGQCMIVMRGPGSDRVTIILTSDRQRWRLVRSDLIFWNSAEVVPSACMQ